jgi:uncharacterized protein (TIGR02300 family)
MAKAELGIKYTCAACGMKFYDLNRTTFACPGCDTVPDASSKASDVVKAQDEVIAGVEEAEVVEAEAETETEDEEDDGVEEIDMEGEAAELRLLQSAGSDDDEVSLDSDSIDDKDELEVSELDSVSFDADDTGDEGTTTESAEPKSEEE